MAENESAKTKTKRGSVREEDKQKIRDMIGSIPPGKKIPWANISRELKKQGITDTANKVISGRKLLEAWKNYLDPALNLSPFTKDEWALLTSLYIQAKQQGRIGQKSGKYLLPLNGEGNPIKWYDIMPRRSPNMIKNLYNSGQFISAANASAIGGQVVFPTQQVLPSTEASQDPFDDSDLFALQSEGLIGDIEPAEFESISVPRSDSGSGYAPPPMGLDDSTFVNDFFPSGSPGGAGAAAYSGFSGFSSPSGSVERGYPGFGSPFSGGKAYKKARKSSRKARKYSRKARKSSRKARKSARK
jgi:hypothetical protein